MVLLDLLAGLKLPGMKLVVAHFDHGIRGDSSADRRLVAEMASNYALPFVYAEGNLGPNSSEALARQARYEFLEKVREKAAADGIITAHHLDDSLETAVHNILRGTGRRGVSSLQSRPGILRPLLHLPKDRLIEHAKIRGLKWREDSTNRDLKYRRNYIRHVILPTLRSKYPEKYDELKRRLRRQHELNRAIDERLNTFLHVQPHVKKIRRHDITMLPHQVAVETVAHWLRNNGARDFNRPIIERLTIMVKAARPRTSMVINKGVSVTFDSKHAELIIR